MSLVAPPGNSFSTTPKSGPDDSSWCLQLVGVFCKALLPGLLPLVWSIAILKVGSCPSFAIMQMACEVLKLKPALWQTAPLRHWAGIADVLALKSLARGTNAMANSYRQLLNMIAAA